MQNSQASNELSMGSRTERSLKHQAIEFRGSPQLHGIQWGAMLPGSAWPHLRLRSRNLEQVYEYSAVRGEQPVL